MQNEKGPLKYYGGSIMINLKDLTFEELQDFLIQMGEKPFRAKQIYTWVGARADGEDPVPDKKEYICMKFP